MPDPNKANLKRSFVRALFRHRWKFVLAVILVIAANVVLLANWPRTYESRAKLLVRIGSESVSLDPTATIGQTIAYEKLQEEEVNSVLEIFNSRTIFERVVDRLGADEVLDPAFGLLESEKTSTSDGADATSTTRKPLKKRSSFVSDAKAWAMGVADRVLIETGIKDPISDRERAIRELEGSLYASAGRKSNVITVVCTSSSPYGARRVVAAAIEEFQKHHIKLSRTEGSHDFFVQQESTLAAELDVALKLLRDRKTEYGMVDSAASRQSLLAEISNVDLEILKADREIQYLESRSSNPDATPSTTPGLTPGATPSLLVAKKPVADDTATATSATTPATKTDDAGARTAGGQGARDGMRQTLYLLEIAEQELLSTHTVNHPRVIALREKRLEAEKIYSQSESADLAALKERRGLLTRQLDHLTDKVTTLNKQAIEIEELARQASLIEQKHREHAGRLEQARIGKEMDSQQISSINQAQLPSFIEKPVSPNKPMALAGGCVIALMAGLALVVSLEWFDSRLRTRDEVEANLNLPVLAVINGPAKSGQAPLMRREFGAVLSRLRSNNGVNGPALKTVAVVGCGGRKPDQIAADFSVSAAGLLPERVVAVDADKATRTLSDRFGANGQPGFSDLVAGGANFNDCVTRTTVDNLTLISAGSIENNSAEQAPGKVRDQINDLSSRFDLVIADLPCPSADDIQSVAARDFDACLLVVQGGATSVARATQTQQSLKDSGANVIGVILQGESETLPHWVRRLV